MIIPPKDTSLCVSQHSRYYVENGNLVIRVTDVLFRVWDEPFRSIPNLFIERYGVPDCAPAGGCIGTDEDPIIIDDVEPYEFDRFLGVLFPPFHRKSSSLFGDYGLNEWLTVLNLSTEWGFSPVREFALKHIAEMEIGFLELVIIGDNHPLPSYWWFKSLVHFVEREETISVEEADSLGTSLTVHLFTAREILGEEGRKKEDDVAYVVREIFHITLDDD